MHLHLPWYLFDPLAPPQRPARPARERLPRAAGAERLFCAPCGAPITVQSARCEVQGRHEHRCTNPLGVRFNIGCFGSAPGCVTSGAPTLAHTWFAGYAWTIALCGQCRTHLGWHFQSPGDAFYGLILARLTIRGAGGNAQAPR